VIERADYDRASQHDAFGRPAIALPRRFVVAVDVLVGIGLVVLAMAPHVSRPMFGFFGIGIGIGIATCVPIGIANIMVIDAAHRHGARRAFGTSIGGALADGVYASLGIFGVGPLLARHPTVPLVLRAVTGCVLVLYGAVLLRARRAPVDGKPGAPEASRSRQLARGIGVGLAATLLNPSALVTWVVLVGSHATGVSPDEGAAWVLGIVVGTFAWFLVVMQLALHGQRRLRGNAAWMTRVVGALVIASGVVTLGRLVFRKG
jgi:arginine exporter protein ArgO